MSRQKKSLLAIMQIDDERARKMFEDARWPDGPACPHCGSKTVGLLQGKSTRPGVYKCKERECRKQFTVTVNTPAERSHIPLRKWVIALYMMTTARKGVSALQLQRDLDLGSYEAAWHMAHRLRTFMMTEKVSAKLDGVVEIDETYVGGKPRPFGPKSKRGRGTKKTPLVVMLERDGSARTEVVPVVSAAVMEPIILENVSQNAIVNTDQYFAYRNLSGYFAGHKVINHGKRHYVDGDIYTNTAESFFALVKRGHYGIFHYISKKHLHRYGWEFSFRWNNRERQHVDTMISGLANAGGKTLTYSSLVHGLDKDPTVNL